MSRFVEVAESAVFPLQAGEAWEAVTGCDLTHVSQPFGPIPGVVAIHDEPEGFLDEPGHSRVLENSDGSTAREVIEALDPPHSIRYTVSELTNAFRHATSGARASFEFEPAGDNQTRVTWHYAWQARSAVSFPLVWLVSYFAFRPYMRRMLGRMRDDAV
jgi:hypothetical protein